MKSNVTSAKSAEAKATVLSNSVTNKQKETSLIVLPSTQTEKKEVKQEQQPKTEKPATVKKEEQPQTASSTMPKRLSIDELTDKADRVYLLRQKYQEVREKRKQLESFTISHDTNNAQLTLIDAKGLSISTSNPVAIGKLLTDWMSDLNNHLAKTESEIRKELEMLSNN